MLLGQGCADGITDRFHIQLVRQVVCAVPDGAVPAYGTFIPVSAGIDVAVHIQGGAFAQQIPQRHSRFLNVCIRSKAAEVQPGEFHQNPGNAAVLLQSYENRAQIAVGGIGGIDRRVLNRPRAVIVIVDFQGGVNANGICCVFICQEFRIDLDRQQIFLVFHDGLGYKPAHGIVPLVRCKYNDVANGCFDVICVIYQKIRSVQLLQGAAAGLEGKCILCLTCILAHYNIFLEAGISKGIFNSRFAVIAVLDGFFVNSGGSPGNHLIVSRNAAQASGFAACCQSLRPGRHCGHNGYQGDICSVAGQGNTVTCLCGEGGHCGVGSGLKATGGFVRYFKADIPDLSVRSSVFDRKIEQVHSLCSVRIFKYDLIQIVSLILIGALYMLQLLGFPVADDLGNGLRVN